MLTFMVVIVQTNDDVGDDGFFKDPRGGVNKVDGIFCEIINLGDEQIRVYRRNTKYTKF